MVTCVNCASLISLLLANTGHSDDERGHFRGSDVGRSDSGEVEMMEFDRQGLPRPSSASMLDDQAGTRAGSSILAHACLRGIRGRNCEAPQLKLMPTACSSAFEQPSCLLMHGC